MKGDKKLIKVISEHPFYFGLGAFLFLMLIFLLNFRRYDVSAAVAEWGQFGDFFGGMLNPIFGLISLVIISNTLQNQVRSNRKQEFDNQFFALLSFYDSVLQSIDRHSSQNGTVRKGRDCFYLFYKEVLRISDKNKISIEIAYLSFFERSGWEVEHYYRTVYHLFKHVRDGYKAGLVEDADKKKYYDLIKSQLSKYELILLYLNCNSQHRGNWNALVADEYSDPFEHLDKSLLNNKHLTSMSNNI